MDRRCRNLGGQESHFRLAGIDGGCQQLGAERMLALGLLLASDLLGADLPKEVRVKLLADKKVQTLARDARERIFREDSDVMESLIGIVTTLI